MIYFSIVQAATTDSTEFQQTISAGTLDMTIRDSAGDAVTTPAVAFPGYSFDFDPGTSTATLGTASERLQVENPTGTATWSVTIAATSGETTTWNDGGSNDFDYNDGKGVDDGSDTDTVGGKLTVDASGTTFTGLDSCATTGMSKGSLAKFEEGVVVNITLMSGTGTTPSYCRWYQTGVALTQSIPGYTAGAAYTLDMTLTISQP